jgi:hypothetical protein
MTNTRLYLVWSEGHGAWWAAGEIGYTRSLLSAGRYTFEEANRICTRANQHLEPSSFAEIAFPIPESLIGF